MTPGAIMTNWDYDPSTWEAKDLSTAYFINSSNEITHGSDDFNWEVINELFSSSMQNAEEYLAAFLQPQLKLSDKCGKSRKLFRARYKKTGRKSGEGTHLRALQLAYKLRAPTESNRNGDGTPSRPGMCLTRARVTFLMEPPRNSAY